MTKHVRIVVLLSLLAAVVALPVSVGAAASEDRSFSLALGEAEFWSGPPDGPGDCGGSCWSYDVTVTEPGFWLRVGIDRPRLGDVWTGELFRPNGSRVGSFSPGTGLYSAELTDPNPTVGTYQVRVSMGNVEDRRFRMRATLEVDNGGLPEETIEVPPNLRPMPPWDFSFMLPVTNGMTGDPGTGVLVPGGRTSCHAEEVWLDGAIRCLRMAYGIANVGLGPLQLQVGPGGSFEDRPLIQQVRSTDFSARSRPAGNAYYHHSHLHYHHDQAIQLELFRVTDFEAGELEAAGDPHRKGFAHRDELLREWTTFYPRWQKQGFGLLPGWADYYEWDRPGNYIDFGLNEDGLYLLRMTADPDGFILETNLADNVAYSLIRVTGVTVEHLESGMGPDPWDECRVPLPLGPEFEDSFELSEERPEECPDLD